MRTLAHVRTCVRACVCLGVSLFCGVVLAVVSCHLAEEERAGCFTLILLWITVFCFSSLRCHGLVCSPLMWHFLVMLTRLWQSPAV